MNLEKYAEIISSEAGKANPGPWTVLDHAEDTLPPEGVGANIPPDVLRRLPKRVIAKTPILTGLSERRTNIEIRGKVQDLIDIIDHAAVFGQSTGNENEPIGFLRRLTDVGNCQPKPLKVAVEVLDSARPVLFAMRALLRKVNHEYQSLEIPMPLVEVGRFRFRSAEGVPLIPLYDGTEHGILVAADRVRWGVMTPFMPVALGDGRLDIFGDNRLIYDDDTCVQLVEF